MSVDFDDGGPEWDGWPREVAQWLSAVAFAAALAVALAAAWWVDSRSPAVSTGEAAFMFVIVAIGLGGVVVATAAAVTNLRDEYRYRAARHAEWLARQGKGR